MYIFYMLLKIAVKSETNCPHRLHVFYMFSFHMIFHIAFQNETFSTLIAGVLHDNFQNSYSDGSSSLNIFHIDCRCFT